MQSALVSKNEIKLNAKKSWKKNSSKCFLQKYFSEILSWKFIFENLSSKIFLPTFIFENVSSKIYLCGENGNSSRKNESMKMKKIASRKNRKIRKIKTQFNIYFCSKTSQSGTTIFSCVPPDPNQCHRNEFTCILQKKSATVCGKRPQHKPRMTSSRELRTWAFHYAPHLYMFSDVLAPRPHSMSFYIKTRTWNSTHFLMNFHDDLHPPDPNQCQNCKNFSIPKGGRGLQIFAGLVLGCIDADFCK